MAARRRPILGELEGGSKRSKIATRTIKVVALTFIAAVGLWMMMHSLTFSEMQQKWSATHHTGVAQPSGNSKAKTASAPRKKPARLLEISIAQVKTSTFIVPDSATGKAVADKASATAVSSRPRMSDERFKELHARPALATRLGPDSEYPHILWPRYTERPLPMPDAARLSPNATNPYVLLLYK